MPDVSAGITALTTAIGGLSPNTKRHLSDRIERVASSGDVSAMAALAAAMPAFNTLVAALDAAPRTAAEAFETALDEIWRSSDAAAILALSDQILAFSLTP